MNIPISSYQRLLVAGYMLSCVAWAFTVWPVELLWRSLAVLLLMLMLVWPILVRLLNALATTEPTGARGRAYAMWLVAQQIMRGPVLPHLLDVLGIGIIVGSVLLSGLALGAVHPLLVPLAFVPLALRDHLCACVMQKFVMSASSEGEK